jgi:hypothetical protein
MTTVACFCGHTWHTRTRDDPCRHCGQTATIPTLAAATMDRLHPDSGFVSEAVEPIRADSSLRRMRTGRR